MRRAALSAAALLMMLCSSALWAQQVEPKEPEIVLPPMLLKVQDVTQAKIDTPLPPDQPPALPSINIALPTAQNIQLGAAAYEVPAPTSGPAGAPVAAAEKQPQNFFTDGLIGVGSMNHIIGDVTLYKLGAEPRFTIEFSHQRLDGYLDPSLSTHFWPAGAGFFNMEDALKGSLTYSSKSRFHFDTQDSYLETENGLQGLGSYSSVNHRLISGNANVRYDGLAPFTFGAGVSATSSNLTLASHIPQNSINTDAQELTAVPTLSFGLDLKNVSGHLSGFYGFTQDTGPTSYQHQRAGGTLTMTAQLPLALTFDGSVGAQWDDSLGWNIPFSAALDGVYRDILSYRLYGGRKVVEHDYHSLWSAYPFLDHNVALSPSLQWYGGASSDWRFGRSFAFQGSVELSQSTGAVQPTALSADGTGLFGFTQGSATVLAPAAALSWNPAGAFSMKMGWTGHFFDPNQFAPVSTFSLNAGLDDPKGRYGGAFTGTMDVLKDPLISPQMPNLSLSGYYRVSPGVTFNLDMNDLLSPLLSSGRKTWNVYTDPGFRVTVSTQISL